MVIKTLTKGGRLGGFKDRRSDCASSLKSAVNPNEPVNGTRVASGPVKRPGVRSTARGPVREFRPDLEVRRVS